MSRNVFLGLSTLRLGGLVGAAALLLTLGCSSKIETGSVDGLSPDPVVIDVAMAYINRPLPADDNGVAVADELLQPQAFNPGAVLYLKDRAASSSAQIDVSSSAWPADASYDVKDLSASYDGGQLLFSMRAPELEGVADEDQPKWNIWEYDVVSATLRRVIGDDIKAEAGQDVSPRYLPGVEKRIVFSSTRQTRSRAILLDDNKPQFSALEESRQREAFVLHAMDNDGTNIEQISYNPSHDLQPTVLADGRVLYTRWDRSGNNQLSLYSVDPYGRAQSLRYGYHSQNTGTDDTNAALLRPQQLADGRLLAVLRGRDSLAYGGDLVRVDIENYIAATQPVVGGSGTQAQTSVSLLPITTDDSLSRHGVYHSANPLSDGSGRIVVSWSQCRVINPANQLPSPCTDALVADPAVVLAPPLFGIWLFNPTAGTQRPIILPIEGRMLTEPLLMQNRTPASLIPPPVADIDFDNGLADAGLGLLHIRSVYDFDGVDRVGIDALANPVFTTAAQRPVRFLRLVKAVSIPDDTVLDFPNTAFGRSTANGMREILGYVPVEPDGSVMAQVPADIAFSFDLVDNRGRRVFPRHNNWLQLRPGERRDCNGCHTRNSELAHGRSDAEAPSANDGADTTGLPFANTDPALFADMGETMAETFARIRGVRLPSVDLVFTDEWTDPAVRAPDPDINLSFNDSDNFKTPTPANCGASTPWSALCRVTIHYPVHIQPLWDLSRPDAVAPADDTLNRRCSRCHSIRDAASALIVPAGQLDLRGEPSTDQADHYFGYRELLFNDAEQEIVGGALIDRLVQAVDGNGDPVFQTDVDGNLILDVNGDPIPVMVTVPVAASMSSNGAVNSPRFLDVFDSGGSHAGDLTDTELKLIAEWLDLGAQYYNNPFAAPVN